MTRRRPHAEFMQIWEEGYLSTRVAFEVMHTRMVLVLSGAGLRDPDGSLARDRIIAHVDALVRGQPHFRLRLQRSILGLTPPAWVPDERFDSARHLEFADTAPALDLDDLWGPSGLVPMDPRHPLWRLRFIPLEDGRVVLGLVLHHASHDGQGALALLSALTDKAPETAPRDAADPFAGVRAARAIELPFLAARAFLAAHPRPRDAGRAFLAKPLQRRLRRLLARIARPALDVVRSGSARRARDLPPRRSAARSLDSRAVARRAGELGGTLSDLLIAAIIAGFAAPGTVALRFPVSSRRVAADRARNSVVDIRLTGSADAGLAALVPDLRAQVAARGVAPAVAARELGAATLLPWVSTPRWFAGAAVEEVIPFAAGLGRDELSAGAMFYNGLLTVSVTTQVATDAEAVVTAIAGALSGEDRSPLSAPLPPA